MRRAPRGGLVVRGFSSTEERERLFLRKYLPSMLASGACQLRHGCGGLVPGHARAHRGAVRLLPRRSVLAGGPALRQQCGRAPGGLGSSPASTAGNYKVGSFYEAYRLATTVRWSRWCCSWGFSLSSTSTHGASRSPSRRRPPSWPAFRWLYALLLRPRPAGSVEKAPVLATGPASSAPRWPS